MPEGGCDGALSACPPSPISPRSTIQAQPHGTHLLDSTLTLQERIAAGNEKIAAKAAAKIAAGQARAPAVPELFFYHPSKGLMVPPFSSNPNPIPNQVGAATVPELPPAPELYFFHPSRGLMENPFSLRQSAAPARGPAQPTAAPAPRLAPAPPLKPTPPPPSTTHAPSHAALRGHYAESSIRSVRPGYPNNMTNNMCYTQQGYAQQSYPGGYQGAQQVAQGGYAPQPGYGRAYVAPPRLHIPSPWRDP